VGPDFEDEKKAFLEEAPTGIYFVFYPRAERLSVLHFPLLGHEIGHIYALIWLDQNFKDKLISTQIEKTLKNEIDAELPPNAIEPIFKETYINQRLLDILGIYNRVLAEVIADLVGAFIFGQSALLSSYIFAIKFGLDDFRALEYGYLSWRFRLYFICKAMKYMDTNKYPSRYSKSNQLIEEISHAADIDIDSYPYKKQHGYIKHIVMLFDKNLETVFKDIETFLGGEIYPKNYNEIHQKNVYERLHDGIIPNSMLNADLDEIPIGLRNIVGATWIFVNEIESTDNDKYFRQVLCANLLSIKAIELSHFQDDFNRKR
jgi:hypothetical protein